MSADDPADHRAGPAETTLEAVWPLFGLRLRSEHLVLRLPTDDELPALIDVAKRGIHPPGEMPFGIAWSIAPSPQFERGFLGHHWEARAAWSPDDWTLHLVTYLDGEPIGAQSILALRFPVHRHGPYRLVAGRRVPGAWPTARRCARAVLSLAFDGLGARFAETDAFLDNAASNGVSRSLGYVENGVSRSAPEGVSRELQRFRLTDEAWRARPRPSVVLEGLDACRDMFGA